MCPHRSRKLDLGTGAGAVERAGEIGDKDPRTLEHADDDEIGRKCPGDLRGESIDPSGDLRCAKQNAQSALCAAEPARPRSVEADAAVDVDCLAGNEAAVVADQEQAGRGDLVDMPLPAERDAGRIWHATVVPFGVIPPGVDAAG